MQNSLFPHVVAVLTVAVWGVTFVNTRYLIEAGLGPTEIFFLRFLIAYIAIWAYTLWRRPGQADIWAQSVKDEWLFFLLGVTGGSLYFSTENAAVGLTHVNNVSFIVCTAPLLTILLALVFSSSLRISARLMLGSALALLGVGVVIFNGQFVLHLSPLGDFLALAAALCWAVYSLIIKKVSGRYGAVFVTRKVFAYGLLSILPFLVWHHHLPPLQVFLQPVVFGNLFFLGLVASFVCFLLWSWVIARIGALKSSNYVYLNPVTTTIASAFALQEPMTMLACLGSAMILLGVYVVNRCDLD